MRQEFLPFSPPSIGDAEIAEVVEALRSDWITTGPRTKRFEELFADACSSPGAVAVASCTDALQVALASLGVTSGDAVFTTTMTFCSTAHVIEHVGATPVLVDVDPSTLNICPIRLREAIQRTIEVGKLKPRAIMPVHFAGQPCDMASIDKIAEEFGMDIVEDAAHAFLADANGRRIGDPTAPAGVARLTAFSFYATKNLTTAEGGMLTGPPDLLDESRLWVLHGMNRDAWNRYGKGGSWYYEVVRPGFKCNMTDLQAAIGLVQLERIDEFQCRRREIVEVYDSGLSGHPAIEVPTASTTKDSALHLYPIRLRLDRWSIDRGEFIERMAELNVGTSVHFIPVHLHPFYADKYRLRPEHFPVASREYERLTSLPLNNQMTTGDAADVVSAVLELADQYSKS